MAGLGKFGARVRGPFWVRFSWKWQKWEMGNFSGFKVDFRVRIKLHYLPTRSHQGYKGKQHYCGSKTEKTSFFIVESIWKMIHHVQNNSKSETFPKKKNLKIKKRTSPKAWWLGLRAFTAKDLGSTPHWGTKIPQAVRCGQKKKWTEEGEATQR